MWVSDITYIPTDEGWLYFAGIKDLFNGELVGYAMNEKMTKSLVMQALFRATASKHPDKGLIAHSDSKNTYTSVEFGKRCREMGVHRSMGSVGDAYDNAMAESFFASLECELIDRRSWKNKTEAGLASPGSSHGTTQLPGIPAWDTYHQTILREN